MPDSDPKDLRYAENLRREGKFQEALKVINDIEKKGTLTPVDKLALLILKGKIYTFYQKFGEAVKIGKISYRLSQSLGRVNESITSLLLKASSLFLGQSDKALKYLMEAEKLLNSLSNVSPSYLDSQKNNILFRKSWAYAYKGDVNTALEMALECLELQEKSGSKSDIAYTLQLLGTIYDGLGKDDLALEYTTRSLTIFEEISDQLGRATSLVFLGRISLNKGNLNQAIKYHKQNLTTENVRAKVASLRALGQIYETRGEIDKALKYYKSGIALAEKENFYDAYVGGQLDLGTTYFAKGEYDLAIDYLKLSLSLQEKRNNEIGIAHSLIWLGMVCIQLDDLEEVQEYLERLKSYETQWSRRGTHNYQLLRAAFLMKKGGTRNRAEAEQLLKQISTDETQPYIKRFALFYLCEFYIEELKLFEDLEVIKELNPLIERLYKFSEEQRMYQGLAEAKLLQAKVALIQMNFEEAQRLLTQAQHVAELYSLNFLAEKISSEHDNYLEKLSEWKGLKEREAPISERLKLASVEDVIERLQGKRAIEPPELVDEEPIVLLIMDKSGISYFNYPFREDWDFEWLFSSFMSAFDTFSSEVFSESIDRIKIGENLILINPVESFLVCYVIKGQSYPGLQKLNRFSKVIKDNTEIWETLNRAVQTGEMLELDKPQSLGNVVNEIFVK